MCTSPKFGHQRKINNFNAITLGLQIYMGFPINVALILTKFRNNTNYDNFRSEAKKKGLRSLINFLA